MCAQLSTCEVWSGLSEVQITEKSQLWTVVGKKSEEMEVLLVGVASLRDSDMAFLAGLASWASDLYSSPGTPPEK